MRSFEIAAAGVRCAVELPGEAVGALRQLFPAARETSVREGAAVAFRIEPAGEVWRLLVDGAEAGDFAGPALALLAAEHRMTPVVAAAGRGRIAFHAGAVAAAGAASLVAGPPEAGKSSTTVQLLELGHAFVADEVAVVEAASGRVLPYPRTPALGSGFAAGLRRAGPRHGELVEPAPGVWRYLPRRLETTARPVASLLLPRYRPGAATRVEELDPGDALTEVAGCCFEPPGGADEGFFDALIALVEGWTIRRLDYGGAAAAREALARILPAGAGSGG